MKFFTNKKLVSITAAVLLLAVAVGTTLAFVYTNTNPVENTFNPSKVACAVVEDIVYQDETTESGVINENEPVDNVKTKQNVKIKNTGDTDAYIRVAIVVTWKNDKGNVYAIKPAPGVDYNMTLNLSDNGWKEGEDGYYYYTSSVERDDLTDVLITSASQLKPCTADGYVLSIEIVASAIQASGIDGVESVEDAWSKAAETTTSSGN